MTDTLTPAQALALIREHIHAEGSQKAFAEKFGLSTAYVSDTINGRREPSKAILNAVGLSRATVYVKSDKDE